MNFDTDDPIERYNQKCTKRLAGLVCQDIDGTNIVDFLGDFMKEGIKANSTEHFVLDGFKFVESEYKKFRKKGKPELTFKYLHIMNYFVEHLSDY